MTKRDRLFEQIKNSPNNVTFADVRKLLQLEGFTLDRITGSHHIFQRNSITFVVPVHNNRVKSVYVKRLIEIIKGDE